MNSPSLSKATALNFWSVRTNYLSVSGVSDTALCLIGICAAYSLLTFGLAEELLPSLKKKKKNTWKLHQSNKATKRRG